MTNTDELVKNNHGYAADVKRILFDFGMISEKGELNTDLFKDAMLTGKIDIKTFIEALK